jgi:hypothetical protein
MVLATYLLIHKPVKCYYFTKQINSSLKTKIKNKKYGKHVKSGRLKKFVFYFS